MTIREERPITQVGSLGAGAVSIGDLADLAGRLADADVPLVALTEGELGAATGPDAPGGRLVPLRWLDAVPAAERTAALAAGRRRLLGRGLLDERDAPVGELAVILPVRARPRTVALADRTVRGVATHRYLYGTVLPGRVEAVLEEDVDAGGAHRFALRSRASAAAHLAGFVDPEGRARADGPPRAGRGMAVPRNWQEVDTAMASVEVVTRLFSTRSRTGTPLVGPVGAAVPEQPRSRRASVVAGPGGVLVIAGYPPATEEQADDGAVLFAQSLSRDSLDSLVAGFINPGRPPTP